MALARARSRLARIEQTVGVRCPACAGRPRHQGVLFRYQGRLTDGRGNDIDPAWAEPCPVCGRGGDGPIKIIVGVDPACL